MPLARAELLERFGSRRKSTTSASSTLTSVRPATSFQETAELDRTPGAEG